jgi:hypothetical protein
MDEEMWLEKRLYRSASTGNLSSIQTDAAVNLKSK